MENNPINPRTGVPESRYGLAEESTERRMDMTTQTQWFELWFRNIVVPKSTKKRKKFREKPLKAKLHQAFCAGMAARKAQDDAKTQSE